MIAMLAEDMLDLAGCEVAGVAATLEAGRAAVAEGAFDLALLDVNLNGERSTDLARMMRKAGTPFIFTTGYGADGVEAEFADVPVLSKPYVINDLHAAMEQCVPQRNGTSSITSVKDSNFG